MSPEKATAQLWGRLASTVHEGGICDAVIEGLEKIWPETPVAVYTASEDGFRLHEGRGFQALEPRVSKNDALVLRLTEGHPVESADVTAAYLRTIKARMVYPLMGADSLRGMIFVGDTGADMAERESAHTALKQCASAAGLALDRAAWRHLAKRDAGASKARASLSDLSRSFGMTHSLQGLLRKILTGAREHTSADKGSLMLLEPKTQELVVKLVSGLPDTTMEERINFGEVPCVRLKVGSGVAGRVAQNGQTEVVEDVKTSKAFTERKKIHRGTLLCVPLMVNGAAIGVMNLTFLQEANACDEATIQAAERIAGDAAVAIHRTRLFEQSCLDPHTGLFAGQVVEALLETEVLRANRYGGPLSVVVCSLAPEPDSDSLEGAGKIFRKTMRHLVDMAGHFGDGWFGIVLPETGGEGARVLCQRLALALAAGHPELRCRRFVAAAWREGDEGYALFERALEALESLDQNQQGTQVCLV